MTNNQIKEFIEKVKMESTYRKFVKSDIIYQLIDIFKCNYDKMDYPNKIKNPLEIVLQFYKDYNEQYHKMIMDGIKTKRIIISQDEGKSFVSTKNNTAYISLYGNDSDPFIIVHELAHYIDRNSNPQIVSDECWFLSEVFSFYMEKKLQMWLDNEKYKDLISIRINNRIYYEARMLTAIETELYYEELYKKKGTIKENDIAIDKIKLINNYDEPNIVNYLLQYPLANIISSYLIEENTCINENEFMKTCLSIDLRKLLRNKQTISKVLCRHKTV